MIVASVGGCPLCARHGCKCFTCMCSLNPDRHPATRVLFCPRCTELLIEKSHSRMGVVLGSLLGYVIANNPNLRGLLQSKLFFVHVLCHLGLAGTRLHMSSLFNSSTSGVGCHMSQFTQRHPSLHLLLVVPAELRGLPFRSVSAAVPFRKQ